jgi:poly(A) polymerase
MSELSFAPPPLERIALLLGQNDAEGLRDTLVDLLERRHSAAWLRALDDAGLLTRIIPELEPARDVDQPIVHFLPVLAHSLEAVAAVDWLFEELRVAGSTTDEADTRYATYDTQYDPPVAVQMHPELRYASVYAKELRGHFAEELCEGRSRLALFRLATLLHDNAKPQTKQPKPGGGVSFHEHQTIGGEVAVAVARRLRLSEVEAAYIGVVVREHMRPGQLAGLDAVTLRAVRRFFQATGEAGPDVLLHSLADHMATRGPLLNVAAWHAQAAWTDALLDLIWGEEVEPARQLLNGDELMRALGIGPGPLVGRLLAKLNEAQADGVITTTEEALLLARRLLREAESVKRNE